MSSIQKILLKMARNRKIWHIAKKDQKKKKKNQKKQTWKRRDGICRQDAYMWNSILLLKRQTVGS